MAADPRGSPAPAPPPRSPRPTTRTRVSLDVLGTAHGPRARAKKNDLDALAELARSLRAQTEALCRQLEVLSAASYLVELEEVLERRHLARGDVTKPLEAYAPEPTAAGSFVTCAVCGRDELTHDPRCPASKTAEHAAPEPTSTEPHPRRPSATRPVTSAARDPTRPPGFAAQPARCSAPQPSAARPARADEITSESARSPEGTSAASSPRRAPSGLGSRPRAAASRGAGVIVMDLLRILLSIVFPPLGVFLRVGFSGHFWLNLLLTFCGYVPGLVHAIWLIAQGSEHRLRTSF